MDLKFIKAFETQLIDLRQRPPFDWITNEVEEAASRILKPYFLDLRIDGKLFFIDNIGTMIVLPWENTEKLDFRKVHGSMLFDDIEEVLSDSKAIAQQRAVTEISANLLLQVLANRKGAMRTRGLAIWGP